MRLLCLSVAVLALATAADPLASRTRQKLAVITDERAAAGSTFNFPLNEINAWIKEEAPEQLPPGVRHPRVELGQGTIDAFANVDFLEVAQARGYHMPSMLGRLISGERPLKLSLRVESANRRATIYLTALELNGVPVSGAPLDLLVQTFFLTSHPEAHINEPFDLDFNVERVEVRPTGVRVRVAK